MGVKTICLLNLWQYSTDNKTDYYIYDNIVNSGQFVFSIIYVSTFGVVFSGYINNF